MSDVRPAAVELENVGYAAAGRTWLVRGITLAVEAGEMVGVLGHNGAGKSTLIRLMSGETPPTEGSVSLDGKPIEALPPAILAQRRAVVPQASALAFPFTAMEVVALGASVPRLDGKKQANLAAMAALAAVGLSHIRDRQYGDLSGGERQRVHVARAFCQLRSGHRTDGSTPVLMLDEPTSSLDLAHQRLVLGAARAMASKGCAVIAVLHDINLAAAYCDRLVLMRQGTILQIGKPSEIVRDALLTDAYACSLEVNRTPEPEIPFVLPVLRKPKPNSNVDETAGFEKSD